MRGKASLLICRMLQPRSCPSTAGSPVLRLIYAFKDQAVSHVYRIFPEPEASLLAGILLGDDNGLSATLQQAYKNTGTAHIIAISGFNIAIIAGVFVFLFSRLFGRQKGAIAAVLGIILYTVLVGATPSVVRAAIMGVLAILAGQLGRRQNGLNTLAVTAAVMAVINPNTLWDVGFQLSFAATLGLILYAQPLQDWFTRLLARRLPLRTAQNISAPVSSAMFFTLAAQLTTLPVMAWQFGRISLVSLIANPFVLPVQPAVMVLSGLAVLLSFIYLPLGQVVAWVAWPFAAYTDRAVEFFNRIPHGVIILGDFSFLFVVLFFGILAVLTFGGVRVKRSLAPRSCSNCHHHCPGRHCFPGLVCFLPDSGWTPPPDLSGCGIRRRHPHPNSFRAFHPGGRRPQPIQTHRSPGTAPLQLLIAGLTGWWSLPRRNSRWLLCRASLIGSRWGTFYGQGIWMPPSRPKTWTAGWLTATLRSCLPTRAPSSTWGMAPI